MDNQLYDINWGAQDALCVCVFVCMPVYMCVYASACMCMPVYM